ncbi:TrbC/VirB2 family protein [Aeromonas veronii]|uniref:Conjugal transfer prepropilin n=1 Tax=Aeromonas veronii TaxID=654 RepID=A1YBN0_AERVE|nr:TrbC/VirB2 family protein [Aeromonas veronii]ABI83638.1 conjugal transfer prepropilin [Aeromonas veronii]
MRNNVLNTATKFAAAVLLAAVATTPAFAAGGLNAATTALSDLKTWLFAFVGIGALVYLLYCVGMAFMERKTWGDVGMGLVYCTLAGGAVYGGTWALELFQ